MFAKLLLAAVGISTAGIGLLTVPSGRAAAPFDRVRLTSVEEFQPADSQFAPYSGYRYGGYTPPGFSYRYSLPTPYRYSGYSYRYSGYSYRYAPPTPYRYSGYGYSPPYQYGGIRYRTNFGGGGE